MPESWDGRLRSRKRPTEEEARAPILRQRVGAVDAWIARLRPRLAAPVADDRVAPVVRGNAGRLRAPVVRGNAGRLRAPVVRGTAGRLRVAVVRGTAGRLRAPVVQVRVMSPMHTQEEQRRAQDKQREERVKNRELLEAKRAAERVAAREKEEQREEKEEELREMKEKKEHEMVEQLEDEQLKPERLEAESEGERETVLETEREYEREMDREVEPKVSVQVKKTAHDGIASETVVTVPKPVKDATSYKQLVREATLEFLDKQPKAFKVNLRFDVYLSKEGATHEEFVAASIVDMEIEQPCSMKSEDGDGARFAHSFHSGSKRMNTWVHIDIGTDIAEQYDNMWAALEMAIDEFMGRGSGWVLDECIRLKILCHKVNAFSQQGSSYLPLPDALKHKHACINVQNDDNMCFKYAVLSALHCDNPRVLASNTRASVYTSHLDSLIFEKGDDQLKMPFDVKDAEKFEAWNSQPIGILSIDVIDMSKDAQYYRGHLDIEYMTRLPSVKPVIWLLRIYNEDKSHYMWLKRPQAFLRVSSYVNPCMRCLLCFKRKSTLDKHVLKNECLDGCAKAIKLLPAEGEHLTRFKKTQPPIPFCVYMDGESMLPKVNVQRSSGTRVYSQHVYSHIGLFFVSKYPKIMANEYKTFSGASCVVEALQWCDAMAGKCCSVLEREVPLKITAEEEAAFKSAVQCHICNGLLHEDRVRDHDHVDGKYRGAAHNTCNLQYTLKTSQGKGKKGRISFRLPVIAHNLKGYDAHFLMQFAGASGLKLGDPIAQTLDKYMTFTIGRCRFLDSMQFMGSSLETLVDNLKTGGAGSFQHFHSGFKSMSECLLDDLRCKGVFPYEWYDGHEKLLLPLPPREAFASKLCGSECSVADYDLAQRVYEQAKCQNFGDYLQLYLKTDVYLLADVMENFRDLWYADHKLDPLNYVTLPGLSWDSMLKKLRDKALLQLNAGGAFEAYPDAIECFQQGQEEMLEFVGGSEKESSMVRGGVSTIMHRYAEANNPYLGTPEQFNQYKVDCASGNVCMAYEEACRKYGWDTSTPESYIMYWDANNLYGWAMSQYLPIGGYAWRQFERGQWQQVQFSSDGYGSEEQLAATYTPEYIRAIGREASIGCMLEVDGNWPDELHDKLNSYPLGPDNVYFKPSPTTMELMEKVGVKGDKQSKLTPNLAPKTKYKVHYRALQQMLEQGFILTRVHRVLEFKQYPILKAYIDFNTAKRAAATNAFEKDLYKLAINSIYGKTNENVENHITVKFAQGAKRALYYAGQPRTNAFRIITNELTVYQQRRTVITYNRPMIVGAAILDISKTLIYDFHYKHVQNKYGERATLLFTDTDSLCYHIVTKDIYADMHADSNAFDMSDYAASFTTLEGSSVMDATNKKVIGKMKDEQAGVCGDATCSRCRGLTPLPHAVRAFAGLRSKMYACDLVSADADELAKKTAKGVQKVFVEKHIKFNHYKAALFGSGEELRQHATFSSIRSVDHQVATIEQTKVSLCAIDTKRYVLEDNVHTLAHGHWRIQSGGKAVPGIEPGSGAAGLD